jgi:lysophospholipid acyltransferase (LPLAT)-like uncharacterized protein
MLPSMKLRHPLLISLAGRLGAWCMRIWHWTLRYRHVSAGPNHGSHPGERPARFIFGLWHEDMLVPAYRYPRIIPNFRTERPEFHMLISQHADGQLIAQVIQRLGLKVVAGSSSRGAAAAVLHLIQLGRDNHLGITPDGPRGPRRRVQMGVVFLAARTGLPIVPLGFGYARAWRTGSWDCMALPRPFSRVIGVSMPPIRVPSDANKKQLEAYRQQVEQAMHAASRWAQELAEGRAATPAQADQDVTPADRAA